MPGVHLGQPPGSVALGEVAGLIARAGPGLTLGPAPVLQRGGASLGAGRLWHQSSTSGDVLGPALICTRRDALGDALRVSTGWALDTHPLGSCFSEALSRVPDRHPGAALIDELGAPAGSPLGSTSGVIILGKH
jgi:hypothetical protein